MSKDKLDSMNILEKAELINKKAKEIQEKNRTISKRQAFKIASDMILGGRLWNY